QIAAAAVRLTDARCVSLWVADEASRTVELRACSDAAIGAGHPSPRLGYGQGVAGWVTLHDEPIKADDLSRTPMIAREWYAAHGLRNLYALPIVYQDSVVGVLVLMGEQPFDLESEEYEILEALIAEAGAAIRNSRLLAESERRRRTAQRSSSAWKARRIGPSSPCRSFSRTVSSARSRSATTRAASSSRARFVWPRRSRITRRWCWRASSCSTTRPGDATRSTCSPRSSGRSTARSTSRGSSRESPPAPVS